MKDNEMNEREMKKGEMKVIVGKEFGGERALFAVKNVELRGCTFHPGESALKCTAGFRVTDCTFTPGARAALWYSRDLVMKHTRVDAPKMFREMEHLELEDVEIPDAQETLWSCRDVKLRNVTVKNADYLFMHGADIDIENYRQQGNYSFQYCRNVVIRNAVIDSKQAFWKIV